MVAVGGKSRARSCAEISGGARQGYVRLALALVSLRGRAVPFTGQCHLMRWGLRLRGGAIFAAGSCFAYLCSDSTTTSVRPSDFTA